MEEERPSANPKAATNSYTDPADVSKIIQTLKEDFKNKTAHHIQNYIPQEIEIFDDIQQKRVEKDLEYIKDKIINSEQRSFLLLGDSGLGKTTLLLNLANFFWDNLDINGRIPLYIFLPHVPSDKILEHLLSYQLIETGIPEIYAAKLKQKKLLLLLDGYDGIIWPNNEPKNLIISNKWDTSNYDQPYDIKVITSCRPGVFA
ncbi:MAG: NACHT domain-containing protein, partial [Gammaproteobacteria bacterium]